jgi:hypothetical protein
MRLEQKRKFADEEQSFLLLHNYPNRISSFSNYNSVDRCNLSSPIRDVRDLQTVISR